MANPLYGSTNKHRDHYHKDFPIGTKVETTLGIHKQGKIIPVFPYREADDGTYHVKNHELAVEWVDGTKGYISPIHITKIKN